MLTMLALSIFGIFIATVFSFKLAAKSNGTPFKMANPFRELQSKRDIKITGPARYRKNK